ncbi:hypothetical protein [Microbacterium sp. XT11]|uniref:hypothetical protein n=1 Tax=Microbacterium sp. XT11 TaxID=367477 RepID=UPI0008298918|nr:hypothetical protein [Microbacterium sp. XT11]
MTESVALPWELQYDAAGFVAIPETDDPAAAEAWVQECLERYGLWHESAPEAADQVAATARMMLDAARTGGARLWFAPPGIYSDVLVSIAVESSAGRPSTEELFDGVASSTAVDVTPLRTETHGAGYLVRWGVTIEDPEGPESEARGSLFVEHWTVLLNDGTWTILIDVLGTTLPVFAQLEEYLPQLIVGITVPRVPAA